MNSPLRIGVFGGTFDPVHSGHLSIARAARDQAALDRVLFVVAASPPHKQGESVTAADLRAEMTAAAIHGEPEFEISRIELDRSGPSYTADTLEAVQQQFPGAALFFIAGYDSALDLPRWRKPEKILERARLLVAPRPRNSRPLPELLHHHATLLDLPEYDISSSEIRARIQQGLDTKDALPPAVLDIIHREGLYLSCP